jgi:spermidine synthase
MLVLLLFFASGATALVYEVLWSKYLSMMLGSTVQAQTVVLAVFMGGLALGNRLFGKRSKTIKKPLGGYAILEFIIGLYAFAFTYIYTAADWMFVAVGSNFANATWALLILKLLISVALMLVPTVLMGGTLPLIAVWIQRQPQYESGARVGLFYAINSLGAMTGAGLAGFYLIQTYGMSGTLLMTALVNLLIALVAAILSKMHEEDITVEKPVVQPAVTPETPAAPATTLWFAMLVALTGGVSMGLEVLSARALALIAGGSLQAFALVLMSFIFGIGLGSIVISTSRVAQRWGIHMVYAVLLAAATLVVANVVYIEELTTLYARARFGLASNAVGFIWHQVSIAVFAFIIIGLPAAFLGAAVPLSIRLIASSASLGDQVGRLLTANTIGAVIGVLFTGFILMPIAGLRGAFATLAILLMAVTAYIALKRANTIAATIALVLIGISLMSIVSTGENWRYVIGSGVFRLRSVYPTPEFWKNRREQTEIAYYKDSADATVSVERGRNDPTSQVILRINGKTDASSQGDLSTQFLVAHLPMAAKPDATNVFLLGFGSGITGGALLNHPIQKLTIAENCRPVLEAGEFFAAFNNGVLTNSRVLIRNEDARAVLKLSPTKYDIIINEPSNPWVVGVGSVFSQEFYELCSSRLTDDGIVAQWFHVYEMNNYIVNLVLRTFASVFPHMEVWDTQEGDIVMLGSKKPWASNAAQYQKLFERPGVRKDFERLKIYTGVALWARQLASQKTARAIAGDGPIQTDDVPILEYAAPRAFFEGLYATALQLYDERTFQFPLADKNKIAVMRALPDNVIIDTFHFYSSSNPDLRLYIEAVAQRASGAYERLDPMGHIIFRPAEHYPERPKIPTNAVPEYATCLQLEAEMLRNPANWREPAKKIEEILIGFANKSMLNPRGFNAPYYAALLGRFAIGDNDYQKALEYLRLGMIFPQGQEQILYLTRVLDQIMPPDLLEELKRKDAEKNPDLQ